MKYFQGKKEQREGTERVNEEITFAKCCSDLDGGEVLEQLLKLEGGELRPPATAGLLIQSVHDKGEGRMLNLMVSMKVERRSD